MQGAHQQTKGRPMPNAFNTSDIDLHNIILHIQQDMAEKVEEIEVKTEEEFLLERNREFLGNVKNIDSTYHEKETGAQRSSLVFESRLKNVSRLAVLSNKYSHVIDTINRARYRFSNKDKPNHAATYKEILRALIMQGLCKLMEPSVLVRTRPEDKKSVKSLLGPLESDYEEITGLPVKLLLDEENDLPKESEGGVIMISEDYTVSLDNTLASRLEHTAFHLLPEINQMLYGEERPTKDKANAKMFPSYLPSVEVVRKRIETVEKKLKQDDINIEKLSIARVVVDENVSDIPTSGGNKDNSEASLFSDKKKNK
ncbi:V-type proton ATPase subunit E [Halyomorpha halys]|uniref:V-type proton ATPase subunit E n=1 Tax=Halyomorpha halys TaxID=286706 RepID=UPI0006D4F804|nr:V-type proton ATPase subunit E [Halyomorpha halys]